MRVNKSKKKENSRKNQIFHNNRIMMGYIFKYVPFLIVFKAVIMIAAALTNVINNVYGTKFVLDSVQQGRSAGSVFAFLTFMLAANLINIFLNAIFEHKYFPIKKEILVRKIHLLSSNTA